MADAARSVGESIFELSTERYAAQELVVISFRGREQVSRPFSFEILAAGVGVDASTVERDLLGQPAHLHIAGAPGRRVHGIVRRVEAEGTSGGGEGRHRYRIWLSPRLWLLGQGRNSRIFQDMTVQQIVDRILDEHNVARRWHLLGAYAPRGYCVQHQESDLRFVQRLLAEEGIFYGFEHPEDERHRETVVFADSATACRPIEGEPALDFHDSGGMVEREQDVRRFRLQHRVRPGSTLLKEFDFLRPSHDVRGAAEHPAREGAFDLRRLRVYDHHGEFEGVDTDAGAARRHLEQHRVDVAVGSGESRCRRLLPGRWFALQGGALPDHDGRYTVVRLEHEGHHPERTQDRTVTPEVYRNRFHCIPAEVPPRPRRPRRRVQQVLETATVVGPAGHEIHTDQHGRIKVQFHWDREGRRDERSSCWIRCMQAWAGTGWGFQFIPRVGMEVMVAFLLGDTDRPMVLGSVYNAEHPPPFPLPREKTRSGIRTQSSRGGDGFNELSFEDRAGHELVYVHAQKDLDTVARNDHTARVGQHLTEQVGANRFSVVGGNQLDAITGNLTRTVGGDVQTTTDGSRVDRVQADLRTAVEGRAEYRVGQEVQSEIGGEHRHEAASDVVLRVKGSLVTVVGKAEAPRSHALHVEGRSELASTGETVIRADEAVTIACGESYIRIAPETIEVCATKVVLRGKGGEITLADDSVKLRAKSLVGAKSDDKVALFGSGSHVVLAADAKIDGAQVQLKAPDSSWGDEEAREGEETTIELVDGEGRPIPNERFRIYLEDGSEVSGVLDDQGKATVRLSGDGEVMFPELGRVEEA
ncbi:hypothetical protein BE21_54320 [Sorangium cellulosum]|uniref:Uncharacterized protein n=1 Tax=Sorangium cellulosum TaxID=56 RepID=A0A150TDL9_SORCE|nr:hypothetical protein BE21_54320 [Sorangium cellulosum]